MSGVMFSSGIELLLELAVNRRQPEDLLVHLYRSLRQPVEGDTMAAFQFVTGGGYRPILLPGSQWKIEAGPPLTIVGQPVTFRFEGPVAKIYGYVVGQALSGMAVWGEAFVDRAGRPVPAEVLRDGDRVTVTPAYALRRPEERAA